MSRWSNIVLGQLAIDRLGGRFVHPASYRRSMLRLEQGGDDGIHVMYLDLGCHLLTGCRDCVPIGSVGSGLMTPP